MTKSKIAWQSLIAAFLFAVFHSQCLAITWDGDGDGIRWDDGFNWVDDQTPLSGDDALIAGIYDVELPSGAFGFANNITLGIDGGITVRGSLSATSGISNGGTILVDNGVAPGPSDLSVGTSLGGEGELVLGDSDFASGGATLFGPVVDSATHVAGHTIRGEGTIAGIWINEGTIRPEDISGDALGTIRVTAWMTNNGILQSSANGDLVLMTGNGELNQGATGRLISDTRKISLNNSTIIGGTLEAANGGYFDAQSNALTLNQVHNQARIEFVGPATLRLEGGGIVNDDTIVISANGGPAFLVFGGVNGALNGDGEVILNHQADAIVQGDDGVTGTNGAAHTIRGVGSIQASLVNNGTIIAEPRNGATLLLLDSLGDSTMTNNNVIRADAGSVLRLSTVRLTQNGTTGRIIANQGTVELLSSSGSNPVVAGGRLETVGTGTIEVTGGNPRVHDITNAGILNVQPGKSLLIGGSSFTNNGTMTLKSACAPGCLAAELLIVQSVTLNGTGELVFTPNAGTQINRISVASGVTATQAAGHTIRGEGLINGSGTLINNGSVIGTSAADFIQVNGTIGGSGLLKNVHIAGTHTPGTTTAIVPLQGAYAIDNFGGQLAIQIGGTTPGTGYDQLFSSDVTNSINIGTTQTALNLTLTGGFVPAVNDTFTIISTAGTLTGQFDEVNLPSIPGVTIDWDVIYNPQSMQIKVLSVAGFAAGDYNGNGIVDAPDYTIWRNTFGSTTNLAADGDGNESIGPGDYTVWKQNFGRSTGMGATTPHAIPEPSSLILMTACAVACLACRARRS